VQQIGKKNYLPDFMDQNVSKSITSSACEEISGILSGLKEKIVSVSHIPLPRPYTDELLRS
jgi:hypothetical protein